jgi:hypothetical protein
MDVFLPLGQFNLIDRLSSLPAPQKLARLIFFYFVKVAFSGKFWCPTPAFIFQILLRLKTLRTHVRINTKLSSIVFIWRNKNYKIKSSYPPYIFFGGAG